MSCRSSSSSRRRALLVIAAVASLGCSEVRGRKKIQEANELYKRGRYQEAVSVFEAAEALLVLSQRRLLHGLLFCHWGESDLKGSAVQILRLRSFSDPYRIASGRQRWDKRIAKLWWLNSCIEGGSG